MNRRVRSALRGMTLLEIMIVLAILAIVMGLLVGPAVMGQFGEAKKNTAKLAVNKLANEAFPQWAAQNPGKACPETIEELAQLTNEKKVTDPWGGHFKLFCPPNLPANARDIAILSPGKDGKDGTDDDIKSW
ncbi:MAG: type II secretion system protein GspG [Kofleriaceae bacterium]